MRKTFGHIILLSFIVLLSSCELIVDVITDDSVGTYTYYLESSPKELSLYSDMDIELIESEDSLLLFEGPEAILDNLDIDNKDGHIYIDYNKLGSWMYDKPKVQLVLPTMCKINLYYDNELEAADTIKSSVLYIHSEGNGDIHLQVDCDSLFLFGDNISDFYISGQTNFLKAETALACSLYGANLVSNTVISNISGSNNQFVHPVELLECNIRQTGNVYYVHKPKKILANRIADGTGQVIYDADRNE